MARGVGVDEIGAREGDGEWVRRAVELGELGRRSAPPHPWVGCGVVDAHGEIAGTGFHEGPGLPHAEVAALAAAGERGQGGTAYGAVVAGGHPGGPALAR